MVLHPKSSKHEILKTATGLIWPSGLKSPKIGQVLKIPKIATGVIWSSGLKSPKVFPGAQNLKNCNRRHLAKRSEMSESFVKCSKSQKPQQASFGQEV